MKYLSLKKSFVVVPAVILTAVLAGTAVAALSASAGGGQLQMQNRGENAPSSSSSTTFNNVPGAAVVVSVPNGQTQLVNARFTAESNCTRALPILGGQCSVQIVARQLPFGPTRVLSPNTGVDYAFDSVRGGDNGEGHALERSLRLPPGNHLVSVQRAVSSAAITFRLDDWHLAVEKSA